MGNRRKGFTLAELIVGVVVMIVTLGVATMSLRSTDQTARREAERLTAYINRQKDKAERIHKDFNMTVDPYKVLINWGDRQYDDASFEASDGCGYSKNFPNGDVNYLANQQRFAQGGTIIVQDANGAKCDITVAATEGRITISSQYY